VAGYIYNKSKFQTAADGSQEHSKFQSNLIGKPQPLITSVKNKKKKYSTDVVL
jgi:hypothetical protein